MKQTENRLRKALHRFADLVRHELRSALKDEGTLLVLVAAPLIYATLYSIAYGAEVLRNVPIGVIDESRTAASRALVAEFDAGPNCYVACEPTEMAEARALFFDRRIYGIAYIPADYEERLLGGRQAVVPLYLDASYFLVYRQVFQELAATLLTTGTVVGLQRLLAEGAELPDLIIADGGKGQMTVIHEVLEYLQLDIPIAGLAKDSRHRTAELYCGYPPLLVGLRPTSPVFHLLSHIQEEVHRFAVSFHRQKRSKAFIHSELEQIPGVGEKTVRLLLQHFRTVAKVKAANFGELAALVGDAKARKIQEFFHPAD